MDKIFGQLTSAPLNETGPVRLCWIYIHVNIPLQVRATHILTFDPKITASPVPISACFDWFFFYIHKSDLREIGIPFLSNMR